MASITITINDNDLPRLKAAAQVNGMSAEEFKEVLKNLCIENIQKAVRGYEISGAKNEALQSFKDNYTPLDIS
jgi:hypothetical protein